MNDNSQQKYFDTNTSAKGKARAKGLAPITIKKEQDEVETHLVKTEGGFLVSNASILEKKGIVLPKNRSIIESNSMSAYDNNNNNNTSNHNMSIESFHPSNLSIEQSNNMSILQESTRKSLSKMSISGESSDQISETTAKPTTLLTDSEGYKVPASRNMQMGRHGNRIPMMKPQSHHLQGIPIENPTNIITNSNWEQDQQNDSSKNETHQEEQKKEEEDDKNEIKLEDLEFVGELGSGSQGHVKKMIHKPSGAIIALKMIDLHTDDNFLKALKTELSILQECNSEYVVKCYGAFLNSGRISIALEYMDKGSLADLLKKVGTISEIILGMITYQVLKGLEYLHKNMRMIHRDIKPSNLLINSDGQIKIADFGVSGKLDFTLQYKSTWVGTLPYMSPERCRGDKYNFDTDLWSLGLTILECALGRYPYADMGSDYQKLTFFDLVEILSTKPPPKLPDNYSPHIRDFVSICLRKEPGTRTTATELLKHSFVKKYANVNRKTFKGWLETI